MGVRKEKQTDGRTNKGSAGGGGEKDEEVELDYETWPPSAGDPFSKHLRSRGTVE